MSFVHAGPPLGPDDDRLHPHSDDWWETETAWFSFNVPERRMGGWFYNQVLAVQGACNGGAWVWDDSPAGSLYETHHHGLPVDTGIDLRDAALPNGNTITVLEPLQRYRLRFRDPGRFEADLTFEAIMPPHSHPLGAPPFRKGRHFDQPGRVHGSIVLADEQIAVDCLSGRDRSWGPRPQGPTPGAPAVPKPPKPRPKTGVGYVFATASPTESFLVYTQPHEDGTDKLTAGYLLRDGVYAPLVEGRRHARFDPATRWIDRVDVEGRDELGRDLAAAGELMSRHGTAGPNGTGLFMWRWGGLEGWGEDQSFCPEAVWAAVGAPQDRGSNSGT